MSHQKDPMEYPESLSLFFSQEVKSAFGSDQRHPAFVKSLERLDAADLFVDREINDPDMARCCLSGLWILLNEQDRSHEICQRIKTPEGSYWHGIVHRIEGDFWNSKYWFAQIGNHTTDLELTRYMETTFPADANPILKALRKSWDSTLFVDFCEANQTRGTDGWHARKQMELEQWSVLFRYCYSRA